MEQNQSPHEQLLRALAGRSEKVQQAVMEVRNAESGTGFREAELKVHTVLRKEADDLVSLALQARLQDTEFVEQTRQAARAQAAKGGIQLRSKGARPTKVRLLGGLVVQLATLLLLPATPKDPSKRRKRGERGPAGSGVYPALAGLGITDRATPALRQTVARQVVTSHSTAVARETLERQGVIVDHKAALRLTYSFAKSAMDARDTEMKLLAAQPLLRDEAPMAGMNLVASLDGGRLRLKEPATDPHAKERGFDAQWREPKLLTIYVVDDNGKRNRAIPAVIDGTMGDADRVAELLIGHLRLLGAQHANHVRFIADGGAWIWARTDAIRKAVGIAESRWDEQLDLPHTIEYLGRVIEPLSSEQIERKVWLANQKVNLLRGDLDEVLDALTALSEAHDLSVEAAHEFLEKHRERLCFLFCRPDGQPMGSGAMESAIRRVVNLRLKGNSKYWLKDHAEAIIHLRSQAITGRWDEMLLRTFNHPVWKPKVRDAA